MVALLVVLVLVAATAAFASLPSSPVGLSLTGGHRALAAGAGSSFEQPTAGVAKPGQLHRPSSHSAPRTLHLKRARSVVFDVRKLRSTVIRRERPEPPLPGEADSDEDSDAAADSDSGGASRSASSAPRTPATAAAAPVPLSTFAGLDFANWGAGHPPDENGDVGPVYYIQTINTSIGIYNKANGSRVAAFTFNSFMSQGHFGNLCDTGNFGDPVVLYDTFEDRWFITDFAFTLDGSGNVNPQQVFQCFAVSKTGDPVTGGWNFYSIQDPGGLGDYPKFGVWPDGIYMSANMFGYAAGASYLAPHLWAIDKAQMYAGAPSVQVADFSGPASDFTLLPANARLQAGTPPAGSPEYFVSTSEYLNAVTVYKLHVDWDSISTSTFTGPDIQLEPNCWPSTSPSNAATTANAADVLALRAMAEAQYSNLGGTESVWVPHTVERGVSATNTSCNAPTGGNATIRWYQLNVTGGTVAANVVQGATYDPEGANTFFRYVPSLAVDRMGDMAVGYTKSNSTTPPQIKYAGRLASDPLNTLGQSEQTLINGTGAQSGTCGSSTCVRWGDYSGMELDPDGCTFWMTGEYFATTGLNYQTEIGDFRYPSCTTVGSGTVSGTVTDGSNPIAGATVALGSRTTTTDANGAYSFTVPAGTYPFISASSPGYNASPTSRVTVPDGGTATQDFSLDAAPASGCFTDNSQTAFQRGIPANCDLVSSPGNVVLASPDNTAAQNSTVSPTGFAFNTTSWAAQTFTPTVSGQLRRADIEFFCSNCGAVGPNVTVSVRNTTGTTPVPAGSDLATATLPGFNDGGAGGLKTVTFAAPPFLTAGTRYALVFRTTAAYTSGTYAYTCSCATTGFTNSNPYASGQFATSTNSGSTWTADTTSGGRDLHFVTYINPGFASSGTFVSSVKDANPAAGMKAHWTTLAYTASTPAGTSVQFQVAGSNSAYGPFTYVGPDGTSSTYFSSGADLSQFDGDRYLRYEAILSTNNSSVTPSLSSVQVCFADQPANGVSSIQVTVPKRATAGKSFTVTAAALDSHGNVVSTFSDPAATVTDSAGDLPAGTTIAIVNGQGQVKLKLPSPLTSDSVSVTSGSVTGTSAAFQVFGPLAQITVARLSPATVGTPYTVKATAKDAVGNVLTTFKGAATVSDVAGGSASGSFVRGKWAVGVTPTSPSTADVATVTAGAVSGESNAFKVLGPIAQLKVTTTGPYVVGQPYSVTALAEDAAGNTLTSYSGEGSATDQAGAFASPSFTGGKATFQMTPTSAMTGDRVSVSTGGVDGTSRPFKVAAS